MEPDLSIRVRHVVESDSVPAFELREEISVVGAKSDVCACAWCVLMFACFFSGRNICENDG